MTFLKKQGPGVLFLILLSLNSLTYSASVEDVCATPECVKVAGSILSAMDMSVDPCKDFYQYACGGFQMVQNIPAGENRFNQFGIIDKIVKKQLRALLEPEKANETMLSAESNPRKKLRRFYKSCIDLDAVEKNNVKGMREMVKKMGGLLLKHNDRVAQNWSLNSALAVYDNFYDSGLFSVSVGPDERNVTQNILTLDQGSLGLGSDSRDYYVDKNVTKDSVLVAMTDLLEKYARLILGENATINRSLIVEIVEFDKRRAEIQQTQAELQDRLKTYNKVNVSWLQANLRFLNWTRYFNAMFHPANVTITKYEPVVLFGMPYFKALTNLTNEYFYRPGGKRILQNYLVFRAISAYSKYIGGGFQAAYDKFSAVFSGKLGSKERWEICLNDANDNIGFPLGAMFIEKYFSKGAKDEAQKVISDTISTFRSRIVQADWMDNVTKTRAFEKVDALQFKVAYPDWLFNDTYMDDRYSSLIITDDYIENQFSTFEYSKIRQFKQIREPRDTREWYMTPHTLNAYYDPTMNNVVILAGILNPPFFYAAEGIPPAINYGSIGSVAGHEITHGFDNMGRQYDKLGNLKEWWEAEADENFSNRSVCFVDKFNKYDVGGLSVKGDQTLGENIADDGGIKVSYQAYKRFEANTKTGKLVGLEDFTPDQLFFLGWAQSWCSIETPAAAKLQLQTDPHSPNRWRVIGPLSNSEDFSRAYNCSANTAMYAVKKCAVW